MAAGRVGLALPGPRCPLQAPGAGLGWAGLSGFGEAGCRPPRSWPKPLAGKERAAGGGVGGAEPGTGFPELLLLLRLESGNGPGLGPSDPLFSAPRVAFALPLRFGFLRPTWVGLGTWTPDSVWGPSSRHFRLPGAARGLVF